MSATTLSVPAAGFEKMFAAIAIMRTRSEYPAAGQNRRQPRELADWRELASAALERKKLGDTLQRAIEALSAKYREVLFLRDVKSLNTAETAWVLGTTLGAVRSRLRRARMFVRNALASGLDAKPSEGRSVGHLLRSSRTYGPSARVVRGFCL